MWRGVVVSLHTAPEHGAPTEERERVRAVAGRGLEGDRYFRDSAAGPGTGRAVGRSTGICEVSLIDIAALLAAERDHGVPLSPAECRRNIVCAGVPLAELAGQDFTIGAVRLRGTGLSEPCARLEHLTRPGVLRALLHHGGLRARVLTGGVMRAGDTVRPGAPAEPVPRAPSAPLR
ncbi:MOSC domain-containing protein [Streptomyces achromogenes]|uniref:MOSC domain-containing protein n=1 Tax=Streptomyces achromogenes TaxID=67255 RepID=UPI0036F5659B